MKQLSKANWIRLACFSAGGTILFYLVPFLPQAAQRPGKKRLFHQNIVGVKRREGKNGNLGFCQSSGQLRQHSRQAKIHGSRHPEGPPPLFGF